MCMHQARGNWESGGLGGGDLKQGVGVGVEGMTLSLKSAE